MNKLTVTDLSYSYKTPEGELKVLKNIDAEFEEGKMYAIVGESGSGKTTFLSLISALDNIQDGEILYNDTSIKKIGNNNFRLKYVNIVFQQFNLIKYMTAAENVQIAIDFNMSARKAELKAKKNKINKIEKEKPIKFLSKVGLTKSESNRLINNLSGGQQQRVAIARTLANHVPIIVADEPTGNLDEDTEEKIISIFQDLAHKNNKIVIIVTHSREVASKADVVYRLKRGKLTKE